MFSLALLKSQLSGLLAIPLQQFSFSNSFPFQKLPTPKSQKQNPQVKSPKQRAFISSGKQGGAAVLEKGRDIVTGETCVRRSNCSAFFLLRGWGCGNLRL
jgi:hypothetical protein